MPDRGGRPVAGQRTVSQANRDLAVALISLVLIAAWEASGWDLALAGWYGTVDGFPWRDTWWARDLLHNGERLLAGAGLLAFTAYALLSRFDAPPRAERLFWLAITSACLVLIPVVKHFSQSSCPWDISVFGGAASYVPHWALGRLDGGPGHCFPSGHAVAAFAFFGLHFLWRNHDRARAVLALAAVLGLGLLFGWTQMLRGAHFPSHVMWSAWLCWVTCALAAWGCRCWASSRDAGAAATPLVPTPID
jgi:membrane-associated PAP2 superfamily phosphatase